MLYLTYVYNRSLWCWLMLAKSSLQLCLSLCVISNRMPLHLATIAKSKGCHSSYFYWCPENSPQLHLFDIRVQHGKQQTLPGPNHCSGFLLPLHVHVGHKVTGQGEQQVQCYAQAVSNVFLHPAFQFIFYGILEVRSSLLGYCYSHSSQISDRQG